MTGALPSTPDLTSTERYQDLWFEDCGFVVRAENLLFRVSGRMLAARSPVFADMLAFTQPDDAAMIDGCPVVVLPDPSREVKVFFMALFNHEFFKPYPAQTDYLTIEGVLRLSHKYQVDSLRKRALIHLGSVVDNVNPNIEAKVKPSWTALSTHTSSIIILCREIDAPWILAPTLYLHGFHFDTQEIVCGTRSFDGRHIVLSAQDQVAILSGVLTMRTEKMSEFLEFLWTPDQTEGCLTPVRCLALRNHARRKVERKRGKHFPHQIMRIAINTEGMKVCRACKTAMRNAFIAGRRKLTQSIPEVFGLPDWKTLETIKVSALT
ncbi:hypothetical protein B0H11DRAFT_1877688 [Mycena galericulata]|nr:hypothetical protein B0H11DRAFT_1877688 [Mycena galericulata]